MLMHIQQTESSHKTLTHAWYSSGSMLLLDQDAAHADATAADAPQFCSYYPLLHYRHRLRLDLNCMLNSKEAERNKV